MITCVNKRKLGCFDHCEGVELPLELPVGAYSVILKHNDRIRKRSINIDIESDKISLANLNECACYEATIVNSANEIVTIEIDGVVYSTFVFQTITT